MACMFIFHILNANFSPSLSLVIVGQLLRYADKRIANIMKVYIERNNLQVELIRFRNKC